MSLQLPLEFRLLDNATFAGFCPGDNQQLLFALKNFLFNNSQEFFYLWGQNGVGKTHLLQACCNNAAEKNIQAMYLDAEYLLSVDLKHNYLDGLEKVSLLCLDNIHLLAKHNLQEERFFYLFNNIRSQQHKLIVSAAIPPHLLEFQLLDLKSRMSWGEIYAIHDLTEEQKITALIMRAKQIGLDLSQAVANFLLSRIERDTGKLFATLRKLDKESLAAKRKLTIPFVKKVLKL
jgi:DnaA family protein